MRVVCVPCVWNDAEACCTANIPRNSAPRIHVNAAFSGYVPTSNAANPGDRLKRLKYLGVPGILVGSRGLCCEGLGCLIQLSHLTFNRISAKPSFRHETLGWYPAPQPCLKSVACATPRHPSRIKGPTSLTK